jgi:hypothetical protein
MSNWQQDFSFSHSNQLRHFLSKKTQPTLIVQGMKEVNFLICLNSYLWSVGDSLHDNSCFCSLLLLLAFPSPVQSAWSCVHNVRVTWYLLLQHMSKTKNNGKSHHFSIQSANQFDTCLLWMIPTNKYGLSICTNWSTAFKSLSCQKCFPSMSFFTTHKSENCEEQGPSWLVNEHNIHTSCHLWHLGMHMAFCILFLQSVDPRATVNSWCTNSTLHIDAHTRHQFLPWYNKIDYVLRSLWQIDDKSLSDTLFCLTPILKQ